MGVVRIKRGFSLRSVGGRSVSRGKIRQLLSQCSHFFQIPFGHGFFPAVPERFPAPAGQLAEPAEVEAELKDRAAVVPPLFDDLFNRLGAMTDVRHESRTTLNEARTA